MKTLEKPRPYPLREAVEGLDQPLDLEAFFGRLAPVEIEIGCGKGKFLVGRAQTFPDRNFLGIDRVGKYMKIGIHRSRKRGLEHLVFMKVEARSFLEFHIPDRSIHLFHIYFPDPWPKRRHHKRRLIDADFMRLLERKLVDGGLVEIGTDDAAYYEQIRESLETTKELWKHRRETRNERILGGDLKTNYELKFEAAGRTLYYMELGR